MDVSFDWNKQRHSRPAIIVLERHGLWAALLRRLTDYPIIETRSWTDCRSELTARKNSVVWMEVAADRWENSIARIHLLHQECGGTPVCASIDRGHNEISLLLCEAGACCVIESSRQLPHAVDLMKRHLDRVTRTIGSGPFDELPWE